ncbi:hypothetical protein KIW84_061475 [Lathyrus oleraceus]|uniref:26S proteasome regulatory subunit Rpn7 N-terminal domain-containing protein n=1 Tax=Pisum sativum TaxID=3888 RepID=A0A9D4W4E9_PEA|nr:hypothetical protein KIW84_061475 [Pisum sativum]
MKRSLVLAGRDCRKRIKLFLSLTIYYLDSEEVNHRLVTGIFLGTDALDPIIISKLRCAAGLTNLEAKKYKLASRKFLETGPELGSHYNDVIASQDVATYGELCALATFDRAELKSWDRYRRRRLDRVKEVSEEEFRVWLERDQRSSPFLKIVSYLV